MLLLIGPVPSLYACGCGQVEAPPAADGGSTGTLAGVALHREAMFDEAFTALAGRFQPAPRTSRQRRSHFAGASTRRRQDIPHP